MSVFRKWLAGCMTVMLLLSPLGAFASAGTDSSGSGDSSDAGASYVRIKNQWKGTYLFEADGQVRYGFTAIDDPAAQWTLEDAGGGKTRIANRATGHYLNMASVIPDDKITAPLEATTITDGLTSALWQVSEADGNPGYVNIVSSDYAARLLNVQTQDGFAHVNNWAQPGWGSALWQLEPASDTAPVRLVDQWKGKYLYEDGGQIKYGAPAMNDTSSQWYVVDTGGGKTALRNRATGHFLNGGNVIASGNTTDPLTGTDETGEAAQWVLTASDDQPGYFGLTNAADGAMLLNVQAQDGYAHANNWAQPGWGSALWKLEAASDTAPVRLKDQWKGMYLYESDGTVRYGDIDGFDKSSQWLVENKGSGVALRNLASGHYAAWGSDPVAAADSASVWLMAPAKDGNDNSLSGYYTFGVPGDGASLLNVQAQDGSAHANNWAQPTWGSAQWKPEDPAASDGPQEPQSPYIRIRNNWLQLYLYEDGGIVKYGNAAAGDPNAEWQVVDADGKKRIQNHGTGHYLTMDGVDGSRAAVRAAELADDSTNGDWTIEDYQGFELIRLASDRSEDPSSQAFLNVENKLKVLQYGVVPRDWGSPKWEFLPAAASGDDTGYVRLKNGYRGTYLYEQDGIVKDGEAAADNPASHWLLKPGEQGTLIVNRATGHLMTNEHVGSYEDPLESLDIDPTWASAQWTVESVDNSDKKVFRNVWKTDTLIHDEDNKGFAQASTIPADWGSAQWTPEKAPDLPAELPEGYVRIQNRGNSQYLYENGRNVALYGTPAANDASSHWTFARGEDGEVRIVNRATGNALSIANLRSYAETSAPDASDADGRTEWQVENAPAGGYVLLRSEAAGHKDEYLHAEDGLGYAQFDLRSIESKGTQWKLVAAPEEAVAPPADEGDLDGATIALSGAYDVRIANAATGQLLVEQNGAIGYASASSGDTAAMWRTEMYNGHTRLRNKATGHYLAAAGGGDALTAAASADDAGLAAQWVMADVLGYKTLTSVAAPERAVAQTKAGAAATLASGEVGRTANARWAFQPVKGDAVYGAAGAFASGGAVAPDAAGGYASGFGAEGASLLWAVRGLEAKTYRASLAYRNAGAAAAKLSLVVNGVKTGTLTFAAGAGAGDAAATLAVDLPLRAGYNTVALLSDAGAAAAAAGEGLRIGALTVPNAAKFEARGATLPYASYEAEDAVTNGTLIGPGRDYGTIAAESSGREAVRLDATGQYVEFRTAQAANALTLRYVVPDSEDGAGADSTLSLYVNGQHRADLTLSSKHSWVYGKYPYSNDPEDGDAHRFYDETHALVGDIPAGAVVRLQKDAGDTASYYVLDVAELEQAPDAFAKPNGYRSVTEFGAVANDTGDDTDAFKAAIAAAQEGGFGVWVPAGTFRLSGGPLEVRDVTIRGAGMWRTTISGEGFMGVGGHVGVYDLAVDVGVTGRHDELKEAAFDGAYGVGSTIQNVWIEHAKAGIWTTLSDDLTLNTDGLYVGGVRVRDTYADGIHLSTGTRNSVVEQSAVRNTGDDAIALWSDPREGADTQPTAEQARTENNWIRYNTVQLPTLADNVAVFGGQDNKITDNTLSDTMGFGAGIAVSTRFNPVPFSGTTIVARNTLLRTGGHEPNWNQDFGAIWLFTGDKPIDADIVIRDNDAIDSTFQGLYISGPNPVGASDAHAVTIRNLVIDGAGTWGINASNGVTGAVKLGNVIVRGTKVGRLFNTMGASFQLPAAGEDDGVGGALGEESGSGNGNGNGNGGGNGGGSGDSGGSDGTSGGGTTGAPAADPSAGDKALSDALAAQAAVIAVTPDADVFSADALAKAAASAPNAKLSLTSGAASFELPLGALAKLLQQAGLSGSAAAGAAVRLTLTPIDGTTAQAMNVAAAAEAMKLVDGTAYRFGIEVLRSDAAPQALTGFGGAYATGTLTVDAALDERTTTALLYDPATGTYRFVPATFAAADGKTVVTVHSASGGILVLAASQRTFADVANHWAQSAIERFASKRIANGEAADRFAPNGRVTRAEFAALLLRSLGLAAGGAASGNGGGFRDVAAGAWYAGDVNAAAALGLVQGDADGSFRPGADITREQMAVMIARAIKLAAPDSASSASGTGTGKPLSGYEDADRVSAWAREATEALLASGILSGRSNAELSPQGVATRAEAVVMLERALGAMGLINK